MALAEICGMKNFESYKMNSVYQNDLDKLCSNFDFQMQLAVPSFPKVSYRILFNHYVYLHIFLASRKFYKIYKR